MEGSGFTVGDILKALDAMTGGRLVKGPKDTCGGNPFVVTKTSGIPGKAVTELPGLVWGQPDRPVRRLAVLMTLTENDIELAAATGVDCLLAHHPVADAANSGGVTLKNYLDLYGLSVIELHEAFHGLHPGIAWLHGHRAVEVDIRWGGIPGNIVYFGETLPGVDTLKDMLERLDALMDLSTECRVLEAERALRNCPDILDACVSSKGCILLGKEENSVRKVIHIFPHTGFSPEHLEEAVKAHPGTDTVLATISRSRPESRLVKKAAELGLNFVCGNSHSLEILENGLPLAWGLSMMLPGLDIRLFRERVTSFPLEAAGSARSREYGKSMAARYLVPSQSPER